MSSSNIWSSESRADKLQMSVSAGCASLALTVKHQLKAGPNSIYLQTEAFGELIQER